MHHTTILNRTVAALLLLVGGLILPGVVRAQPQSPSMLDVPVTQVAAGYWHTCALTTAGGVQCWGYNPYGQLGDGSTNGSHTPVAVSGLSGGVVAIAAGTFHTCALTTAGGVECWGVNGDGQLGDGSTTNRHTPVAVSGLAGGVAAIAAGRYHTCALTTSGGVQCWGYNNNGQLGDGSTTASRTPVAVSGFSSGVVAIAAGDFHTCALTTSGGVQCWGDNNNGRLGDGSTTDRHTPVAVSGLSSGVVAIAAGTFHTCALTTSGGVQCWGYNNNGQLGDGSTTDRHMPVAVSGLASGVAAIATGRPYTCALTTAGGVKCWGKNDNGQLGNGSSNNSHTPVAVSGLSSGVVAITAGGNHACARTTAGGVKCWGKNLHGQLGDGSATNRHTPVAVTDFAPRLQAVAAGGFQTCGLTTAGSVYCWGRNGHGELGDGSTTDRAVPVAVLGLDPGVKTVATALSHSCAVTAAGTVKCWGLNDHGQLGDGSTTDSLSPVTVSGLTDVTALALGDGHSCALTATGTVECWGYNFYGQLGDGSTNDSNTPVAVTGLAGNVVAIDAYGHNTCALTAGGAVQCWGDNQLGQLGTGDTSNRNTATTVTGLGSGMAAIATGNHASCAATTGGAVQCWGGNFYGQLGDGSNSDSLVPVASGLSSDVVSLAGGIRHFCATLADHTVQCWGFNGGQLGDGSTNDSNTPVAVTGLTGDVAMLAAGGGHNCVLSTDGRLQCWGGNTNGQLGIGSSPKRPTPVSVLAGQSLAFSPGQTAPAGSSQTVSASATEGGTAPITFDTWTPETCSVSGTTLTTTGAPGSLCGVRASRAGHNDGANGTTAAAPQELRIIRITQQAASLAIGSSPNPADYGQSVTYSATLSNANAPTGDISFCADATTTDAGCTGGTLLCTVAANASPLQCSHTGLDAGSYTISAYFAGDANNAAAVSGTVTQTVDQAAQAITNFAATPANPTFTPGGTFSVSATGGASGEPVVFSSATTSVCTVSGSTVTMQTAGTCTLHADQAGNANYTAAPQKTLNVTLGKAAQAITNLAATPANPTFTLGGTFTVSATGGASGEPVVFSSATSSVCTVSGSTVTMQSAGTCTLHADQTGNANYAAAPQETLNVTLGKAAQAITNFAATPANPTFTPGGTFTVSATGGASGEPVVFSSATSSVCTVSGSTVTMVSAGTCTLRADQAGNANYAAAPQETLNVTLGKATQILSITTPSSVPLSDGSTTVTVSASSGLPVTLTSSTPSICAVSGSAPAFTVDLHAAGSCQLTAEQAGDANYTAVSEDVSIDVQAASMPTATPVPTLDWRGLLALLAGIGLIVWATVRRRVG